MRKGKEKVKSTEFMWAGLFHFGSHMWNDAKENEPLELDYEEWKRITDRMAAVGMNAISWTLAKENPMLRGPIPSNVPPAAGGCAGRRRE